MPTYTYTCTACETKVDKRRAVSERDEALPCPECGEETKRASVYGLRFNLPGDDWASKNGRISGQMAEKNRKLKAKEEQMKRDAPGMRLAPNVEGERVDTWSEAKRLAESKGKDGSSYDPMIKKEQTLATKPEIS